MVKKLETETGSGLLRILQQANDCISIWAQACQCLCWRLNHQAALPLSLSSFLFLLKQDFGRMTGKYLDTF